MNIVEAAKKGTVLEAALCYLESGLSVLPVRGKQPAVNWSQFQIARAPFSYVHNWERNHLLGGVGIICGKVSNGLCVIDLDGLEAVARFEFMFPHLLETFTVTSGSGRGKHIYLLPDTIPPTTRTKGFELRADGAYVVAPPSIHPDSKRPYTIAKYRDILRVPDLQSVCDFITETIKLKQDANKPTEQPSMGVRHSTFYGQTALDSEARRVAAAPIGEGNNTLYRAALKLGSLVCDGHLSVNEVEIGLMRACATWSTISASIECQCMRTIKSGIRNGMRSSRAAIWESKNLR